MTNFVSLNRGKNLKGDLCPYMKMLKYISILNK